MIKLVIFLLLVVMWYLVSVSGAVVIVKGSRIANQAEWVRALAETGFFGGATFFSPVLAYWLACMLRRRDPFERFRQEGAGRDADAGKVKPGVVILYLVTLAISATSTFAGANALWVLSSGWEGVGAVVFRIWFVAATVWAGNFIIVTPLCAWAGRNEDPQARPDA